MLVSKQGKKTGGAVVVNIPPPLQASLLHKTKPPYSLRVAVVEPAVEGALGPGGGGGGGALLHQSLLPAGSPQSLCLLKTVARTVCGWGWHHLYCHQCIASDSGKYSVHVEPAVEAFAVC